MWMHQYVSEKLRELEREQVELARRRLPPRAPRPRPVLFAPLARAAGRGLRRLGEGLESWSTPGLQDEREVLLDSRSG